MQNSHKKQTPQNQTQNCHILIGHMPTPLYSLICGLSTKKLQIGWPEIWGFNRTAAFSENAQTSPDSGVNLVREGNGPRLLSRAILFVKLECVLGMLAVIFGFWVHFLEFLKFA
jgi:hypothetical protein